MVAMGTSLADKAWGSESASYRVAGVINVICGWFLTAFIAFTICGIIAVVLFYGKLISHEKKCGCKQQHEDCWDKKMNRP